RRLAGLALFLSIFWNGLGRAQETEETPLLEEAEDPWAVLQSTPGVLTDRINVDGSSGCGCSAPKPVVEAGAAVGQSFSELDQILFSDRAAERFLPVGFEPFLRRMPAPTGEADLEMPDPQLEYLARHGTGEWKARAFLGSSGGEETDRAADGFDSLRSAEAEAGGPLAKDRAWIWGGAYAHEVNRLVLGGQKEEQDGWTGKIKLNFQLGLSASLIVGGRRGDSDGSGLGAAPGRAPETTWEEDERKTGWAAESTVIHNNDFYSTLRLSTEDGRRDADPRSSGAGAQIGADGVVRGSWFGIEEEQRRQQASLRNAIYRVTGRVSHDLALGAGWGRQNEDQELIPPGPLVVDGRLLGLGAAEPLLETWRAGTANARTETLGLWAQDTLSYAEWTAFAGLQADRHNLGIDGGPSPWTIGPRLGMNWRPCCETVVWASLGRFASRLGARAAWHVDADAPALLRALFEDRDGDLSFDPGEPLQPLPGEGIDPLRPGFDPDRVDSRLRPETIDDAVLAVEGDVLRGLRLGLRATWRRTSDLLEERLLVRDGATGEVFAATAGDWVPTGRLTGTLPDGTPYDVPFWDLRPGLVATGGTLLTNGDRRQEDLGLSLTWKKSLSSFWWSEGHVTWSDGDRRLGSEFRRFDDPTNTLGGGDDAGDPVAEIPSGRPRETPRFVAPRWSFDADALFFLPREFRILAAVHGRRGDPLPYYRQVARERAGLTRVQLTGDAGAFRTDDVVTVDAALEKEMSVNDATFLLRLEALNLLDEDTVLDRELDLSTGRAAAADETLASRTLKLVVKMWWNE
ncbi:MAG TPA: hypothetical protein VJ725_31485, partial [Thermoanaerobaculia bacterium]|nr:hypothetical protein [Thermoanaerobaculia bacterium]